MSNLTKPLDPNRRLARRFFSRAVRDFMAQPNSLLRPESLYEFKVASRQSKDRAKKFSIGLTHMASLAPECDPIIGVQRITESAQEGCVHAKRWCVGRYLEENNSFCRDLLQPIADELLFGGFSLLPERAETRLPEGPTEINPYFRPAMDPK